MKPLTDEQVEALLMHAQELITARADGDLSALNWVSLARIISEVHGGKPADFLLPCDAQQAILLGMEWDEATDGPVVPAPQT